MECKQGEYQQLKESLIESAEEREKHGKQMTRWDAIMFSKGWAESAWKIDKVILDFRKVMELITKLYEEGILG